MTGEEDLIEYEGWLYRPVRLILPDDDYVCDRCGQTIPRGTVLVSRHPGSMSHEGDCPPRWTPTLIVITSDHPAEPEQMCSPLLAAVEGVRG
jgi:hypothetical protein